MKNAIHTDKAPQPVGPYSQAIESGEFLFLSGQGPLDPATGKYAPADVATETKRTFANVKAVLEAAGSSLDKVVKMTVYLKDIADFKAMNEVYATMFAKPFPSRTTIQAGALPMGISVEIECIARK